MSESHQNCGNIRIENQLPKSWQLIVTGDGSPSLKYIGIDIEEAMHHSGGAFAETRYIYEPLLRTGLGLAGKTRIISLGLGLGYNEIFAAHVFADADFELYSFEIDPWLREEFKAWIAGESHGALFESYQAICRFLGGENDGKTSAKIRERLNRLLKAGDLHLEAAFNDPEQVPKDCELFLWDAFSRKTSPELWDENFLKACFARGAETAGLATYASPGNLKRALKASGFHLETRAGFQGKRSSTWAGRGKFPAKPGPA